MKLERQPYKTLKCFPIRLNKEQWKFVKQSALDKEISMNSWIVAIVEKYRKRLQKVVDPE